MEEFIAPHTDLTGKTVYVLTYVHKHGQDVSVYASREGAAHGLADICRLWWEEGIDRGVIPPESIDSYPEHADGLDDPTVVGAYFHYQGQWKYGEPETWEIDEVAVQP